MTRQKSFLQKFIVGAVLAMTLVGGTAHAALIFDVRIAAGGGKSAAANPGVPVNLEVWAIVTGAVSNAGLEGFANGYGSLLSNTGGASGNFTAFLRNAAFDGSGSQTGALQDLDADGDLDIGSNATKNTSDLNALLSGSNLIFLRSDAGTAVTAGGVGVVDGQSFLLGTTTWTPSGTSGVASLNWRVPTFSSGLQREALWQEDDLARNDTNGSFSAGLPVNLSVVPEPSTVMLIGLGAVGLLVRRRRAVS